MGGCGGWPAAPAAFCSSGAAEQRAAVPGSLKPLVPPTTTGQAGESWAAGQSLVPPEPRVWRSPTTNARPLGPLNGYNARNVTTASQSSL